MIFENTNVEMMIGENNEPLFELYSVGVALGYGRIKTVKGREYQEIQKNRIKTTIKNAEIEPVSIGDKQYLTEEMIYDFMFEAKTDKCKSFRKWLSQEVLPSIRQNGAYVSENITDKAQELLVKYSTPQFRANTFATVPVENIRSAYEECMEYNSKKSTKDKISIMQDVVKALTERRAIAYNKHQVALASMIGDEIITIQKEVTEKNNRSRGGKLSAKTKKINQLLEENQTLSLSNNELASKTEQLESELIEASNYINYIDPRPEDYECLHMHGLSVNRMYEVDVTSCGTVRDDFGGKPKLKRTKTYNIFSDEFRSKIRSIKPHLDKDKEYDIFLYFDHKKEYDCHNFHKSFFDALSKCCGVNDRNFHLMRCDTNRIVDTYKEGKIYFHIRERINTYL